MRPGFLGSFRPAVLTGSGPAPEPFTGVETSFEFNEAWPGTRNDLDYPDTFTGFSTPTNITPLENFELETAWPGTTVNVYYPDTFTGFDTPANETPLESFEADGGWPGTVG